MSALRGLYAGMLLLGLRRPCEDGLKPRRRTPRPYCVAAPERMRGSGGERLPRSRRPQRKRLRRRRSQILIEGEPATRLFAKRGVSVYINLYLPPARTRAHIYVCIIWRYAVLRMRSLRSISTSPCIPGIPKNTASRSDRSPKGSGPTCYNDIGIRPVRPFLLDPRVTD